MVQSLLRLNHHIPATEVVSEFIQDKSLINSLIYFLDDYSALQDEVLPYTNLACHALRIVSYTRKEKALPYLHHLMLELHRESSELEIFNELQTNLYHAIVDGLFYLSQDLSLYDTFKTLYKTTLNKEVALEYLKCLVTINLNKKALSFEERFSLKLDDFCQKEMNENFIHHPESISYLALMTLNTELLISIENYLSIEKDELKIQSFNEWGEIKTLETWYVLHLVQNNRTHEKEEYIKYLLTEEFYFRDFNYFYSLIQGPVPMFGISDKRYMEELASIIDYADQYFQLPISIKKKNKFNHFNLKRSLESTKIIPFPSQSPDL